MRNDFGIFHFIAVNVMCLLLAACGGGQSSGADIDDHLKVSLSYQNQGQFRAAIIEAQNAIQKAPEDIRGHKRLARIYNELGAGKKASDLILKLDEVNDPELIFTLHAAYELQGKFRSASKLLEQHPALQQTHAEQYLNALAASQAGLGDSDAATSSYQQALAINPNNSSAILGLAKIEVQRGDLNAAATLLDNIGEDDSSSTQASLLRADIAYARGQLAVAEENLNSALFTLKDTDLPTPQRVKVLRKLIEVLTQQGRSNEAYIYSKSLADANPLGHELNLKFQQAIEKYQSGELEEAEKLLLDIHKQSAGSAMSGQMLGMINYLQGDIGEAEGLLSEYVDTETASTETKLLLASAHLRSDRPERALTVLAEDAKNSAARPEILAMYGLASLQTGNSDVGVEYIQAALQKNPGNTDLRLALARHYASLQEVDKAVAELRNAFKKTPADERVQVALVEALLTTGNMKDADSVSQQILRDYPQASTSFTLAGNVALAAEKPDIAKKHFTKAQSLDAEDTSALFGLANIELSEKRWQQAENYFKEIAQLDPQQVNAYRGILLASEADSAAQRGIDYIGELPTELFTPKLVMAERYIELGNYQPALAALKKAQAIKPESKYAAELSARALLGLSQLRMATGEFAAAREHVLSALQIAPQSLPLLQQLARVDIASRQNSEVKKTLALIDKLAPNDPLVHELRGDHARAEGDINSAINSYRLAWQGGELESSAGKLYQLLSTNQPRKAKEFLEQWQEKQPNSPLLLTLLAQQKENAGDTKTAIKLYEKAIDVAPNSPGVLNNLAWLYHTKGDKRGMELAERAYQLAPRSAAIADTYGWILANNGEKEKAIEILEYAASLAPGVKEIEEHLAKAKAL